mgnify:CR=1 FL=1
MSKPRICIDCCLRTAKLVCPRCRGETDIDEYSPVDDEPDDEDWDDDDVEEY